MRVEFPEHILHLEEQPGQRLVNPEPERAPGPLPLGRAQSTIIAVGEEVFIVVPRDEAVVQHWEEGGDYDERERNPTSHTRGPQASSSRRLGSVS